MPLDAELRLRAWLCSKGMKKNDTNQKSRQQTRILTSNNATTALTYWLPLYKKQASYLLYTHLWRENFSDFSFLQNFLFFLQTSSKITSCIFSFCPLRSWAAPPSGRRLPDGRYCHRAKEDRKMADLRKIYPESLPCRVNYSRKTSFKGKLFILLCVLLVDSGGATTHWVVTEDGKIQQQVCQLACSLPC